MTVTVSRSQWLRLYKELFTEATKFNDYNYREYAKRRIRDHFRRSSAAEDPTKLVSFYEFGVKELSALKRQTVLMKLYSAPKLIIENLKQSEQLSNELEKIGKNIKV